MNTHLNIHINKLHNTDIDIKELIYNIQYTNITISNIFWIIVYISFFVEVLGFRDRFFFWTHPSAPPNKLELLAPHTTEIGIRDPACQRTGQGAQQGLQVVVMRFFFFA